jgi:hypothetical protein
MTVIVASFRHQHEGAEIDFVGAVGLGLDLSGGPCNCDRHEDPIGPLDVGTGLMLLVAREGLNSRKSAASELAAAKPEWASSHTRCASGRTSRPGPQANDPHSSRSGRSENNTVRLADAWRMTALTSKPRMLSVQNLPKLSALGVLKLLCTTK